MAKTKPEIWIAGAIALVSAGGLGIVVQAQQPVGSAPTSSAAVQSRIVGAAPFTDKFMKIDSARWFISDGWSNGSYMVNDWQSSQVTLAGPLKITLAPAISGKYAFSSGEMQSRRVFGHGYFETTMRAAPGSGMVSGFFTYTGPPFGKPWNEIDVEILGAKPSEVLFTYFYRGKKISHTHKVAFDTTKTFNTYGFDWQPGSIEWYVNGKSVHKVTGNALPIPNEAQKIFAHIWASDTLTGWVGPFTKKPMPTSAFFKCIGYSNRASQTMPCK